MKERRFSGIRSSLTLQHCSQPKYKIQTSHFHLRIPFSQKIEILYFINTSTPPPVAERVEVFKVMTAMTTKHLQELSGSFLAQLPPAGLGGVWSSCKPEAPAAGGDSLWRPGGEMWADGSPHLETGSGSPQPPALSLPARPLDTARKHFCLWSLLYLPHLGGSQDHGDHNLYHKDKRYHTVKTTNVATALIILKHNGGGWWCWVVCYKDT